MSSQDEYWANYSTLGGLISPEKAREAVIQERGCTEEEWNQRIQIHDEAIRQAEKEHEEAKENQRIAEQEALDRFKERIAERNRLEKEESEMRRRLENGEE